MIRQNPEERELYASRLKKIAEEKNADPLLFLWGFRGESIINFIAETIQLTNFYLRSTSSIDRRFIENDISYSRTISDLDPGESIERLAFTGRVCLGFSAYANDYDFFRYAEQCFTNISGIYKKRNENPVMKRSFDVLKTYNYPEYFLSQIGFLAKIMAEYFRHEKSIEYLDKEFGD